MDSEPIALQTRRLLLRPQRIEDTEALSVIYADDEAMFYLLPSSNTPERTKHMVENALRTPWSERPSFVVVFQSQVIGNVVLEIDRANQNANLGYVIARDRWERGFGTEAARAVVDYGFRAFGLAKVYARADPRNVASARVLEKLGMTREGLLRSHVIRRGERVDRAYYGLLREEWQAMAGYNPQRSETC